jgi:peptide/nickel transport system substrate-binding protein
MLYALGKVGTPCCFIMPERIAKTDPFKQIEEYIGSGPMKFVRADWKPGALAAFEKFKDYAPRSEPSEWWSGSRAIDFDRIEWVIMPDPATASAALQSGEIDWWETPVTDLIPVLKRNRNIKIDIADPLGNIGSFRLNHLHPPFNDVKVRRAVQMALSQEDYMRAVVGSDTTLWSTLGSVFTPGTPVFSDAGGEVLTGPRSVDGAKKLLAEAGYSGLPVTCLIGQDQPPLKAMGEITADLLKKIGMTVDFVATDWGTVGQRRASKQPPGQGGWGMFHTWHSGADAANPAGHIAVRAGGEAGPSWFGWPKDDEVEKGVAQWFDAKTVEEEKAAMAIINRASMSSVTWIPTGFYKSYQAWRSNLSGL